MSNYGFCRHISQNGNPKNLMFRLLNNVTLHSVELYAGLFSLSSFPKCHVVWLISIRVWIVQQRFGNIPKRELIPIQSTICIYDCAHSNILILILILVIIWKLEHNVPLDLRITIQPFLHSNFSKGFGIMTDFSLLFVIILIVVFLSVECLQCYHVATE